jgi:hypothetical protein
MYIDLPNIFVAQQSRSDNKAEVIRTKHWPEGGDAKGALCALQQLRQRSVQVAAQEAAHGVVHEAVDLCQRAASWLFHALVRSILEVYTQK